MTLRRDADFTEETVGFAIESLLTILSFPRLLFTIEPFSRSEERWLGADARLDGRRVRGFRPFYMQFKRPFAYPDYSSARIVSDRKKLKLSVFPSALFFPLRDKKPRHKTFQHNVLFRLRQRLRKRNLGDAAYVCPLFLDRSAYRFHVQMAGLSRLTRFWRFSPWDLNDLLINDGSRTLRFERIPILGEHISIPPHEIVTTAKHSYSFNQAGSDLCFHSPTALPEGADTLANFLKAIGRDFLGDDGKITLDTAREQLSNLLRSEDGEDDLGLSSLPESRPDDPIASWPFLGDMLRNEFGIEQYAFVRWDEF
jgi:hypothetical protein